MRLLIQGYIKNLFIGAGVILVIYASGYIPYVLSAKKNSFNKACKKLGFDEESSQALLEIFYLSGYFEPDKFLHDIKKAKIKNADSVFNKEFENLKKAHVVQGDKEEYNIDNFRAASLNKVFFKNSDVTERELLNLIFYQAQNAFGRKIGEERDRISGSTILELQEKRYLEAAKKLNLIDRIEPSLNKYDEAWIAGARRSITLLRIIDFEYAKKEYNITIKGNTYILAGERNLTPSLDYIDEGLYDLIITNRYKNLDPIEVTKYNISNAEGGNKQLAALFKKYNKQPTETLAAKDILEFLEIKDIEVLDTKANGDIRPTTSSTVKDAVDNLIQKIDAGEFGPQKKFVILLQTNNPYVERQTLVAQREVNKALVERGVSAEGYQITIKGIGAPCVQDIKVINSELGALIAEKWTNVSGGEDSSYLLFQTRGRDEVNNEQGAEGIKLVGSDK